MRTAVLFVVLATLVAFTSATILPRKISVKITESANAELILKNVVAAVEYAFTNGIGSNGRMILLENELRTLMPNNIWFVTEGASGIAHTPTMYVYMKVVDVLIPYTVHVVGA